jgi:16S rRNA (guanine966-N2)-methyltransferase
MQSVRGTIRCRIVAARSTTALGDDRWGRAARVPRLGSGVLQIAVTTRPKVTRRRNRVRIIGGRWRGHLIPVIADSAVRPTPDRVRETLFNWLAPSIRGACCLDLFAGTGALGLEALSRGAADCVFVERDRQLARSLRSRLEALESAARVVERAAMSYLRDDPAQTFDIVFLDPPYAIALEPILLQLLEWLRDSALVYVERPRTGSGLSSLTGISSELGVAKEARAGDVLYGLLAFGRE